MDILLVAFTLIKSVIILYGVGKGMKFLIKGFGQKDDALKIKGFKYAAITIGLVILLTALEFFIVWIVNN